MSTVDDVYKLLRNKGIGQRELAKKLGVGLTTLNVALRNNIKQDLQNEAKQYLLTLPDRKI